MFKPARSVREVIAFSLLALTGCTVGPDDTPPAAPEPVAYEINHLLHLKDIL